MPVAIIRIDRRPVEEQILSKSEFNFSKIGTTKFLIFRIRGFLGTADPIET